jgi:hypothetical protein
MVCHTVWLSRKPRLLIRHFRAEATARRALQIDRNYISGLRQKRRRDPVGVNHVPIPSPGFFRLVIAIVEETDQNSCVTIAATVA